MKTLKLIKKKECCSSTIDIKENDIALVMGTVMDAMCVRYDGEFEDAAIYLPNCYNYVVGEDSLGATILVPLKKK